MSSATIANPITNRQFNSLQSRPVQGWSKADFIKCKLKVCRQTAYIWDLTLLESLDDYGTDPNTNQSLWASGQAWNHHQMWCLVKVKRFMIQSPKPTIDDLRKHLTSNQHLYSHQQFFKEHFNHVNNDSQATSK